MPSSMKQVGLGRGCIRLPRTHDDLSTLTDSEQSTAGGRRLATSSPAFNVDALIGPRTHDDLSTLTDSEQSTAGGRRLATSSPAFNVDALIGRPNITCGGCIYCD